MRDVALEAMQRGAIMAELVEGSMSRRCGQRTRRSLGAENEFAQAPRTIHCFCGKACGQAGTARRGSACFRASRWIARVLSNRVPSMICLHFVIAAGSARCAIMVR